MFSLLYLITISAQQQVRENSFLAAGFSYGLAFPVGELSDRFGSNFQAGVSLDYYNLKLKGSYGIEGQFLFGDNVREDVLSGIRTADGAILASDGAYAEVFLRQRGTYLGAYINKTFFSLKKNPYAGINAGFGVGILQHKVRIQDDTNSANQFNGDYSKGYDRNTMGPAIKQSLTFQNIGRDRRLNYSIGFTITEGFTNSVRTTNFDNGFINDASRLDILIGFDAKWFLPIKDSSTLESEEFFY